MHETFRIAIRRACDLTGFSRAACYKRSSAKDQTALRLRLRGLAQALERVIWRTGRPTSITCDHGTEFTSKALEVWADARGVQLDFTRPGNPTDNGLIESFNGRLRDECLNVQQFLSLDDAKAKLEAWRRDYNEHRPHGSLGRLTPVSWFAIVRQNRTARRHLFQLRPVSKRDQRQKQPVTLRFKPNAVMASSPD